MREKKIISIAARDDRPGPLDLLKARFPRFPVNSCGCDVAFRDVSFQHVIAVVGLVFNAPVLRVLFSTDRIADYLLSFGQDCSILIDADRIEAGLLISRNECVSEIQIPEEVRQLLSDICKDIVHWPGHLNSAGEHIVDLGRPFCGPHFNINLLLGNRLDFSNSLQTTPKSVVDCFGRGSFRSHAAVQVLATRWDLRQEENGFPANRQFYLLENGKVIFYSGAAKDSNLLAAKCIHSQNFTRIFYQTACGLEIKRCIFILAQKDGHPIAVESHRIEITNTANVSRNLSLVYTGMFGTAAPHALWEDVLYSNIIMQAKILKDHENNLIAVGDDYYPDEFKKDLRFHCTVAHCPSGPCYPTRFSFDYTQFIGNGTLERPENASQLSNCLCRKGPGFFAVGVEIRIKGMQTLKIDNFTGVASSPPLSQPGPDQYIKEIQNLLQDHLDPDRTDKDLEEVNAFFGRYRDFIQIQSDDHHFDTYFNRNLPFQVLYQTYVSRSFGQTQKGYREIGFREIQDIYASVYYLIGMGKQSTVKDLLRQWIENVFEFGYANHNFFWSGKEPGKWSDDPLWLVPALYRYINLTGDIAFLDQEFHVAGVVPSKKRRLIDTIRAIITYSAEISVGRHGLPLIDSADWNDCLKIDGNFLTGPEKEHLYHQQTSENKGVFGGRLESDFSESVMNAFLLKQDLDLTVELCRRKGDTAMQAELQSLSESLYNNIQRHAWKDDFFARVLLNRFPNHEFDFIGASNDGLSADPAISGVYFLNSFSWSVLSGCATGPQIATMVTAVENYLKTPHGLKLMTPAALERIAKGTATGHYFPGDRENGAVFKHAAMMAVAALFKASKEVADRRLAQRTACLAYWMLDLAMPYKTLNDPYQAGGNPRFCTQYINSETGENIGPLLSGTSTWMLLSLLSAYGIEFSSVAILFDPILRESQTKLEVRLNTGEAVYEIHILKPVGFFRIYDSPYFIEVDQKRLLDNQIPIFRDQQRHLVTLNFLG